MAKFIELTKIEGNHVLVNVDHILGMFVNDISLKTTLVMSGGESTDLEIEQSYDEVKKLLVVE